MFQRYGVIAVLVWVLSFALACSSKSSDAPPSADTPAGEVVEVSGAVIAEASVGGEVSTRRLAVGDKVTGAETIITGADGVVTIVLAHNQARWTLTAGKRRRVNQSAAWRAPKAGSDDLLASKQGDETAVAGRHAEREAADTSATALKAAPETKHEEIAKSGEKQRDKDEIRKEVATMLDESGEGGAVSDIFSAGDIGTDLDDAVGGLGLSGSGSGGGGSGEGTIGLGSIGTVGKGGGATKVGSGAATSPSGKVSFAELTVDGLDRAQVARVMRKYKNAVRYCYELELKKNPDLAGSVTVTILVDATGRATSVKVSGDSSLDVVRACLSSRFRRLKYPAPTADSGRIEQRLLFKVE